MPLPQRRSFDEQEEKKIHIHIYIYTYIYIYISLCFDSTTKETNLGTRVVYSSLATYQSRVYTSCMEMGPKTFVKKNKNTSW